MFFLNLKEAQFRSYKIEDDSVLTEVFYSRNRQLMCSKLQVMWQRLQRYMQEKKLDKKIGRLGFKTEKNLLRIFKELFGSENNDLTSRRIMASLWEAFQMFRLVSKEEVNKNSNSYSMVETYRAH